MFMLVSSFAYFKLVHAWPMFVLLLFIPDVSMLGYLKNAIWGARIYNLFHTYLLPASLFIFGWLRYPALISLALIWFTHIGLGRLLGYGLKPPSGFKDTHLGKL